MVRRRLGGDKVSEGCEDWRLESPCDVIDKAVAVIRGIIRDSLFFFWHHSTPVVLLTVTECLTYQKPSGMLISS